MSKKNIYLIRHGEIQCGREKMYIGVSDIQLSNVGIDQAYKLKHFFESINVNKLYCSDLKRTVETSRIISESTNLKVTALNELREINMGDWEGKTFKEIKLKFPDEFQRRIKEVGSFKPNGGESFYQVQKRAVGAFQKICKSDDENILVVAHAGVNRSIISWILQIPMENIFRFKQDYGCINKIVCNETGYNIEYINRIL